jgi:ABC-type transport system involved in multi-copper enzyme maturation permease subunit
VTTVELRVIAPVLRAELRRVASTRLWWALLVPPVLVAALAGLFGGRLGPLADGGVPVLPLTTAFALANTSVFAAVYGAVAAAGEFRHRTAGTAYVVAGGRGWVLLGKLAAGAAVGALYAAVSGLVAAGVGALAGGAGEPGALLAVGAAGVAVTALWGALGAAVGTLLANQVGAVVVILAYLQVGELILSSVLDDAGPAALARVTGYLPGNAGDVAVYTPAARSLSADAGLSPEALVGSLAGVADPPSGAVALLVLAAWTGAAAALAWAAAARRDVT